MSDFPGLFDRHAEWVEPSDEAKAALPPSELAILDDLRDAAAAERAARIAVSEQKERITTAVADLCDAENYLKANYPPTTHMDNWRAAKTQRAIDRDG